MNPHIKLVVISFIILLIFFACQSTPTIPQTKSSPDLIPVTFITVTPSSISPKPSLVAFIVGDWQQRKTNSLWITQINGTGEIKLLDNVGEHISWASDGKWLAVTRGNSLWVISPDGTKSQQVFSSGKKIVSFKWSHDSKKIAFYEVNNNINYSSVVNIETGITTYLTKGYPVSWSPDDQWLAIITHDPYQLIIINTMSQKIIPLEANLCFILGMERISWSPKNDSLIIWTQGNGRFAHGQICIATLDGQGQYLDIDEEASIPFWDVTGNGFYTLVKKFDPLTPVTDKTVNLLYVSKAGQINQNSKIGDYSSIFNNISLSVSPNKQWLAPRIQNNQLHVLDLIKKEIITKTIYPSIEDKIITPDHPDNTNTLHTWASDNQHLILMLGDYGKPDGTGSIPVNHGVLYALDIHTGQLKPLTHEFWIKYFAVSPP